MHEWPRAGAAGLMNKSLVLVTDIPSPYRVHLFNALHQELAAVGVSFEVLFMAKSVPIRYWSFDETRCTFRFRIFRGLHPRYKNDLFHFNPGILWTVVKKSPTWLVIGGAWNMPTVMALLFIGRKWRKACTILWSEANHNSMIFDSGIIAKVRALTVRKVDAFAIPGRVAEETIRKHWGVTDKPFLPLPNVVDEQLFKERVIALRPCRKALRRQRKLASDDVVLLWPARLHEETKGILNFLHAVAELIRPNVKIFIVGEGGDRGKIESWLKASANENVVLLGQQTQEVMVELYALSDVLLLPSLRDPNPLSVVEGLWAGLPLFISRRCGNWPEALHEGVNGWLVDPNCARSMQVALRDLISKSREELYAYGQKSVLIAEERFATTRCVRQFIDALSRMSGAAPVT